MPQLPLTLRPRRRPWPRACFASESSVLNVATTARLSILSQLMELSRLLLVSSPVSLSLNLEDARAILGRAGSFRIGSATASGPDRATQAAQRVAAVSQLHLLGPKCGGPATSALLSITSQRETELEMTDMLTITHHLEHTVLTTSTEIIFGHGRQTDLAAGEICVCLLIGYAAVS